MVASTGSYERRLEYVRPCGDRLVGASGKLTVTGRDPVVAASEGLVLAGVIASGTDLAA
jgi:hypothetical protein